MKKKKKKTKEKKIEVNINTKREQLKNSIYGGSSWKIISNLSTNI